MEEIFIKQHSSLQGEVKRLPSSKSLSNRALILQALAGNQPVVSNLSDARDTVLMNKLVGTTEKVVDVMDAGTTMRFLTAYFGIRGSQKIMTGTARMKERPIGLLVDALRAIGVSVDYVEREGFPPIELKGFSRQLANEVTVPGNVSSQYISALMMTGPLLPNGLRIKLQGKVGSRPYIDMTAALMKHFGVEAEFKDDTIHVKHAAYKANPYRVEGDWSGASYWFAHAALAREASLYLPGMIDKSLQGDRAIVGIMEKLGVNAVFDSNGVRVSKSAAVNKAIEWDFTDCPDLAQTVLPVCAAKGVVGTFTGLESLYIKETDRVTALRKELGKINAQIVEPEKGVWRLEPGKIDGITHIEIETYHDHRMAMGLAPLATIMDVTIKSPEVVNKSYPGYWEDMRAVGFSV
ncbi:MAG TPA: 3-phosphoshikimate 1-carboxyvinyltransferase [Cyclobacteriaceae bacterium]|nr:3-phosphoshikimate 1-carboxyvinyltransferase [Cyclobacteriaceae bacterium]